MTSTIRVASIEPLERMEATLKRFSVEVQGILEQTKAEIDRTRLSFEQCEKYWKREIRNREVQLQQAKTSLFDCLRSPNDDCATARKRVGYCEDQLKRAKEELKTTKDWKDHVEKAIEKYERQTYRLNLDKARQAASELKVPILIRYRDAESSTTTGRSESRGQYLDATLLPSQIHHYSTNKHSTYTAKMERIVKLYGLKLDEEWNKEALPHQGRHPEEYHAWVLAQLQEISRISKGDTEKFISLFEKRVKNVVKSHPDMLRKHFWYN